MELIRGGQEGHHGLQDAQLHGLLRYIHERLAGIQEGHNEVLR